jgi:hypothetical protein
LPRVCVLEQWDQGNASSELSAITVEIEQQLLEPEQWPDCHILLGTREGTEGGRTAARLGNRVSERHVRVVASHEGIHVKLFLVSALFSFLASSQNVGGVVTSVIPAGSPRRNSVADMALVRIGRPDRPGCLEVYRRGGAGWLIGIEHRAARAVIAGKPSLLATHPSSIQVP